MNFILSTYLFIGLFFCIDNTYVLLVSCFILLITLTYKNTEYLEF